MSRILAIAAALSIILIGCSENSVREPDTQASINGANPQAESSAYQLVETVSADGDTLLIPYQRYVYPNGLTVLVHEDSSDPLVHVNVTYHVGSAREEAQRSGFAHFFEHMMFQGSAHVGDEEHFRIVTESGGTLNGSTNADRTNYFQTVPSNQLETALWLEADRMGFLLEAVTQEKFEIQRATVKNERGQNYDNRPYGLVNERTIASLYPAGHPYSWPVIGYPQDLDAATLDELKNFFLRWYGPNNATLVIAGNIDSDAALELINKYFGGIPAGPAVERAVPEQISLDQDRYISYVDRNIRFPRLVMTFPTVPYSHPDRTALAALASIIGGGKNSLLYQRFVLSNKAISASAFSSSLELGGTFRIDVQPYPAGVLADFETEVRAMLTSFDGDSISDEDLQMFKGQSEAALVNGLQSVQGKASRLAMYDYLLDQPNYLPAELAAIRSLSEADILRVFEQYIAAKPAVLLSVLTPQNPDAQARPDNFTPSVAMTMVDSSVPELEPRPVVDNFDRSRQPGAGDTPLVTVPPFWRQQLSNGAEIIGTVSTELPALTLRLEFAGGHLLNQPDSYGLASLTAAMMNEGTQRLSAEQFEAELQKLGSSINVSAGRESMLITLSSLRHNLDATLALLEQRLFESDLNEDNLQRLRQQQIESLQAAMQQPSSIANDVYNKLLYGDGHSFSVPVSGVVETVQSISLDDVRTFSRDSLTASALKIVTVGDIEEQSLIAGLDFLNRLPAGALPAREQPEVPQILSTVLYLVDKPGAAQSEIRIGYINDQPYDATGDFFKTGLMNYVLGGSFNSRINLNLREDKGYTYGARSNFSSTRIPGPFTASASVRTDTSADSVRQFMNEIVAFRDAGITAPELEFMRSSVAQRDALSYETLGQKAGFLGRIIEYDLAADFVTQQNDIIDTITQAQINTLAQEQLPLERMLILVVGDKAVIGESLQELGYPMVELDTRAHPLEE